MYAPAHLEKVRNRLHTGHDADVEHATSYASDEAMTIPDGLSAL